MLGAIFGDVAGSVYEFNNTFDYDFPLITKWSEPTDDSYMTLAVAKALMESLGKDDEQIRNALIDSMKEFGRRYPNAGYGGMFARWVLSDERKPYNSFGNGSAMRVSPAGWLYDTLEETLHAARLSAEVTHNHLEGIKGAQAIAECIFMARNGSSKEEIGQAVESHYGYDLSRSLNQIREHYGFYETCQKSVPEAISAFLQSESFEDAIRKAITLGGDSDTIACMTGSISEAFYGIDQKFITVVRESLEQQCNDVIDRFITLRKDRKQKHEVK